MFKTFEKIYSYHKKKLKYLNHPNKKVLVAFSGTPASGKTTISKYLQKKYKAIYINPSEIIEIIKKHFPNHNHRIYSELYLLWFLEWHDYPNKFIILDASLDRKYLEVWALAKQIGFNLFVIDIETKKKVLLKRFFSRNKKNAIYYIIRLKQWTKDHKLFRKRWHVDIIIHNDTKLNLGRLYERLDSRLNGL